MKDINININFDSLFFPLSIDRKSHKDPSYFQIADRFFAIAEKYRFKYTIFVIGRDLENAQVFERVREWSKAGHEIGNHSYTHNINLGWLPKNEIENEVMRSHEMIFKCTGVEPKGFISPNWSTSTALIDVLQKNNYLYDTSQFPSYFLFLILLKLKFLSKGNKDFNASYLKRRDKISALFGSRKPSFAKGGLLIFPVPTVTPFRIPCWHTMGFVFGKKALSWLIKKAITGDNFYYYLAHPKDLADIRIDLSSNIIEKYGNELVFEGMNVSLKKKLEYFESSVKLIAESGRRFATLKEIALNFKDAHFNDPSDNSS